VPSKRSIVRRLRRRGRRAFARWPRIANLFARRVTVDERRAKWEAIYALPVDERPKGETLTKPASQLVRFFEQHSPSPGVALDVGSGPGVMTAFLAERLGAAVALDVAWNAVQEARCTLAREGFPPLAIVAAAPDLPIAPGSLDFFFDRGCMHLLPPEQWALYMETIGRILKPGGYAQLIEHTISEAAMAKLVSADLELLSADCFVERVSFGSQNLTAFVLRRAATP
jgi:SAM-dependent methyltransferase